MATFTEISGSANPFNSINVVFRAAPTFADIDKDGDLDAFVGTNLGTIRYYQNNGGTFTELSGTANPLNSVVGITNSCPTFADIDSDGDLDAFVGTEFGTISYYQNTGGTFTQLTGTANPLNSVNVGYSSSPTFADIDSDGDLDAFVGGSSGTISYYQNNGGTFTQLTGTANPLNGVNVGDYSFPTFADLDSDGDLDAIIGTGGGTIAYYQNTGGTFTQLTGTANPFNGFSVGYNAVPTFADIDSDGDLDAFVGAYDGSIHYYQNGPTAPVNTPPVANPDTVSTNQNTATNISVATLLANDTDANNDPLSITGVSNFTGGTAVLNNNGTPTNSADDFITFTPTTGFSGNASFNYSISDGKGGSSSATVTVAVNAPPIANADTVSTNQNTATNITVATLLANDTDANNDPLSITGVSNFTGGTAVLNNNGTPTNSADDFITFTPTTGFSGNASFNYSLSDGKGGSSSATVTVGVGGTQIGTGGNDTLTGTAGNDSLNGGNGNDTLIGNAGNDTLIGGNGSDLLFGNAGNDLLTGDNGDDTLRGGLGNDILTGGTSKDVFVFAAGEGTDTITDFTVGSDKIGLTGGLTFGNLSFSGNQIRVGSEVLAVLTGVNTNTLTASNFVTV
ncbi:FG-GAP-like repeat-containing protein [Microcoleus sp. AR_TQ3_B6]|uniref:Ig-like domain-containing protein n=1 Tax=Microcoleus sp. AR_TQ3_B6 TaxID=3055284 RepID=UPI002FD5031D